MFSFLASLLLHSEATHRWAEGKKSVQCKYYSISGKHFSHVDGIAVLNLCQFTVSPPPLPFSLPSSPEHVLICQEYCSPVLTFVGLQLLMGTGASCDLIGSRKKGRRANHPLARLL